VRCVFFAVVPSWDGVYFYVRMTSDKPQDTGLYVLEETPTLLLITLYSQQLLVWARSYHMATSSVEVYQYTVLTAVWAFNVLAYVLQVLIWALYDHTSSSNAGSLSVDSDAWSLISALLHTVEFFAVAVVLGAYGKGVYRTVHEAPVSLATRTKQLRPIVLVSATCTAAFLVRSGSLVAASYAAWTNADGFDDELTLGDVISSLLFFVCTELVPLVIVLRTNGRIFGARNARGSASSASPGRKSGLWRSQASSPGAYAFRSNASSAVGGGGADGGPLVVGTRSKSFIGRLFGAGADDSGETRSLLGAQSDFAAARASAAAAAAT
jgi:hypothetical protein